MSLRKTLFYLTIALLVESVLFALKHPLLLLGQDFIFNNFGPSALEGVTIFFDYIYPLIQAVLYCAFCYYIHLFDIQFTDAFFGRFFRLEIFLTLLIAAVTVIPMDKLALQYISKAILELVCVANAIFAGRAIFKYFKTEAMMTVRLSYYILAGRHLLYAGVLSFDIYSMMENPQYTASVIINWVLLMPILIASRFYLYKGFKALAESPKNMIKAKEDDDTAI